MFGDWVFSISLFNIWTCCRRWLDQGRRLESRIRQFGCFVVMYVVRVVRLSQAVLQGGSFNVNGS